LRACFFSGRNTMQTLYVLLFDGFETLDAMGPVEMIGRIKGDYRVCCVSQAGKNVTSSQGVAVATISLCGMEKGGILLVPGGQRTRTLVADEAFLRDLKEAVGKAETMLCICTGAALLAKAGLLTGRRATTNKRAFAWVSAQKEGVYWQKSARWVVDGKFYTSSGVSAGIDMALGFVADKHGKEAAERLARETEYIWHANKEDDPFALA
jgi:transcriptional regulator GlxA family with amidase domain